MPPECIVLADEQIGKAVPSEIDKPQIGVAPIDHRKRRERVEGFPIALVGALEESRCGTLEIDEVKFAVSGKVHQLLAASAECGQRRLTRDQLHRAQLGQRDLRAIDGLLIGRAEIGFVEPTPTLFAKNAGQTFAVQIGPAIMRAINSVREILQALWVNVSNGLIDFCLGVFELERRKRT